MGDTIRTDHTIVREEVDFVLEVSGQRGIRGGALQRLKPLRIYLQQRNF